MFDSQESLHVFQLHSPELLPKALTKRLTSQNLEAGFYSRLKTGQWSANIIGRVHLLPTKGHGHHNRHGYHRVGQRSVSPAEVVA